MNTQEMTIEQHIANIKAFAYKHKIEYDLEGEVGFGRSCVGFLKNGNYIAYNPCVHPNYDYLESFYDERLSDIAPDGAYHKHDCLAVLGHDGGAIIQLSEWASKLEKLGATIQEYRTGATGIQAMLSGTTALAVKL